MKTKEFAIKYVVEIPKDLSDGILYVSHEYKVAIHLCACGCGEKTVTPIGEGGWVFSDNNGLASLHPSIGNQQFECQSHYMLTSGTINWL